MLPASPFSPPLLADSSVCSSSDEWSRESGSALAERVLLLGGSEMVSLSFFSVDSMSSSVASWTVALSGDCADGASSRCDDNVEALFRLGGMLTTVGVGTDA